MLQAPSATEGRPNPFYIQAVSPQTDELSRVLKHGDTFGVFDHYGDIKPGGLGEEGLYHDGTRYLSCLMVGLAGQRPLLLSSTVKEDNDVLIADLTNSDLFEGDTLIVPRGTVHLFRRKFLWKGVCYEQLRLYNFGHAPVQLHLAYYYEADFADIFEVRGTHRPRRGHAQAARVEASAVSLGYEGLDGLSRRSRLEFKPQPAELSAAQARFEVKLVPREVACLELTVGCQLDRSPVSLLEPEAALMHVSEAVQKDRTSGAVLHSTRGHFNEWVNRAAADLCMMVTDMPTGPYPYAGVPWFSTPFGRDGIWTAFECLWFNPSLARGVLAYLAATQAAEVNPAQDAQPGKILHEARGGEMASLGEIPFGRYYGSVDATPLFVFLAGAYFQRTGDREFLQSIEPNIERALRWIDAFGDSNGDGFVDYHRQSAHGLVQQGWKDSSDSVFHADGKLAEPPIALCEVQGYVYAAKQAAADLADAFGRPERAANLRREAEQLQQRFEEAFWCEDLGTYALALDGQGRPCRVPASNAGHCLTTGIAQPEHGRRCGADLLDDHFFTGWGIRTISNREARYNPMSYHNGSVWPHDNALIALGLSHYGLREGALRVLTGMYDVSRWVDLHRLPELFCGFHRRSGEGPTLYPVACAPQSWAAAAVFLLLQACLGLTIQTRPPQLTFTAPQLPSFLNEVHVTNLSIGDAPLDLVLKRQGKDVGIDVQRRGGEVEVQVIK